MGRRPVARRRVFSQLAQAPSSGPSGHLLPAGEKRLAQPSATSSPLGEKVAAKRPDEGAVRSINH
ncbi:MAG: hypothetical protein E5Y04_25985 [Mesorhizobium sp.]|nr:hypothetical protein EOD14_23945 [Mesorhizobium sp. M7A.T.Ca.US.000.02.1.1]RUT87037.1 hypothetical protein EOD15_24180 [Mesorhizobium sp. M7A.T.Ca.US.000.02.2.1]RUT99702.1 hypothetical protein EOD12_21160 [Mesorhizobium sp. M7A.T.Ca.TU.009.02.1.1]RUU58589.1 hypothetical protein EOC99_23875 [Mesorhizobium sp. M7A.T.Ca.TU.009.01.1.1]RUU81595.1 hypothetical protein EOD03_17190 [Mesorhizobium sp. M7A.T.Ca.TU.009.01.1.2]TJV22088.1 MAG: hypothetical protein E5Y04_25985 [Mesorhizobium sp.]